MLSASDDLMRLPASRDGDGGVSQLLHIDHLGASWPTLSRPQVIFIPSAKKALTHAGPDIMGLLLRRAVACELTAIWFLEASAVLGSRAEGDRGANC